MNFQQGFYATRWVMKFAFAMSSASWTVQILKIIACYIICNFPKFAIMKLLAICMMTLVIGLSLVPCCTPIASIVEQNFTSGSDDCCQHEADESKDAQKKESGCDTCSPFFSCGSCTGFTFQPSFSPLSPLNLPTKVSYSSFELQLHSEYFETKWQPPKISWLLQPTETINHLIYSN